MVELGYYWKKFSKIPFEYADPKDNAIYLILFFENKRTVFIKKDLSVLCTFETRKARQLLEEAQAKGWASVKIINCKFGDRPPNFPREADIGYYIEVR